MLRQKTLNGVAWQGSAKIITQVFSLLVNIILARHLSPSCYGLVGMAVIFTGFLDLISDFGVGSSIVQKSHVSDEELNSIFWFVILVSLILFASCYSAAPFVSLYFNNSSITGIIRVFAVNYPISALRIISYSLLNKELMFKKRTIAEIISSIASGLLAITLAYMGAGVWSIVFNTLIGNIILTILLIYFAPWKLRFYYNHKLVGNMVKFGTKIMMSRVQWYVYSNSDFFIVAKLLGEKLLGYYSVAFNYAMMPTEKITAIINQVMFPVFSKLKDDNIQLTRYFFKTTKYISMITFPLSICLFILVKEFIVLVLTDKWLPIIVPFRALCVIGMIRSVDAVIPHLLLAKGRADLALKYTTVLFIVLPSAFFIGSSWKIEGVAFAWMITYPLLVNYLLYIASKEVRFPMIEYFKNIYHQIAGCIIMSTIMLTEQNLMSRISDKITVAGTLFILLTGITSYIIYQYLYQYSELMQFKELYKDLRAGKKYEQLENAQKA